jgi:hypothetical protein
MGLIYAAQANDYAVYNGSMVDVWYCCDRGVIGTMVNATVDSVTINSTDGKQYIIGWTSITSATRL